VTSYKHVYQHLQIIFELSQITIHLYGNLKIKIDYFMNNYQTLLNIINYHVNSIFEHEVIVTARWFRGNGQVIGQALALSSASSFQIKTNALF